MLQNHKHRKTRCVRCRNHPKLEEFSVWTTTTRRIQHLNKYKWNLETTKLLESGESQCPKTSTNTTFQNIKHRKTRQIQRPNHSKLEEFSVSTSKTRATERFMMKLKTLAKHDVSIFQAQANTVKHDVCNDLPVQHVVFYACFEIEHKALCCSSFAI